MRKKCLLAILVEGCIVMNSFAQVTLSGKVIDAENGLPVRGANVRLEQTTIGCATNAKGEFTLSNVKEGEQVLRVSCLNYAPLSRKISGSNSNLVLKLKNAYINLDQVVVTGTGTHHKLKDTPVPIEVMSAADIKKAGITDFSNSHDHASAFAIFFNQCHGVLPDDEWTEQQIRAHSGEW